MRRVAFFVLLLTAGMPTGVAEQLLIETVRSEDAAQEKPARGQTMERVRQRFGEPEKVRPAVGDPPISRWIYPDYTVYFEGKRVIHTVARR